MVPVLGNVVTLLLVDVGQVKTWSSVSSTTNEQTVTVPGLRLANHKVMGITKPTLQAGLTVGTARVSADDTLAITFIASGGAVTPTANETYTILVCQIEQTQTHAVA